jgi:hypothetical protein
VRGQSSSSSRDGRRTRVARDAQGCCGPVEPQHLIGVPAKDVGDLRHLPIRLVPGLADLQCRERGELVAARDDAVGDVEEELGALGERSLRPGSEGFLRSRHGRIHIGGRRDSVASDDLVGSRRIDGGERLVSLDFLAADDERVGAAEPRANALECVFERLVRLRRTEIEPPGS